MLNHLGIKNIFNKEVYLDYASSTPIDRVVSLAMHKAESFFANPSALHKKGVFARKKIEESRAVVANFINARVEEIIFTSGGTEGNNLAIYGALWQAIYEDGIKKPHVIISEIEHSATRSLVKQLETDGVIEASYILPDENGTIDPKNIREKIKDNTVIVSIHMVNNEIGTIEPIKDIAKTIRHYKKQNQKSLPLFHTDAAQATAYLKIDVKSLGVDMLSFNGQKIYGPRSSGVLFVNKNIKIRPIFIGGNQEFGLRPGTESLPNIVGLAKACEIAKLRMDTDGKRLYDLQKYFKQELKKIPNLFIYADNAFVAPHIIAIEIKNTFSEALVLYLDSKGIYVASKSACRTDDPDESYVLNAVKNAIIDSQITDVEQNGAVRFSLGRNTKKSDIDYAVQSLKQVLQTLNP